MTALRTSVWLALGLVGLPGAARAHEAWLLAPDEVIALSRAPVPELFTSPVVMMVGAGAAVLAMGVAMGVDGRLRRIEAALFAPLAQRAALMGPPLVRIGLALMLGLAAFGGLPRAGTVIWTEPVLFVPNMQLGLAPGWVWIAPVQAVLALMLLTGLLTRVAGLGVLALALLGVWIFGAGFLPYAAHFAGPALVLALLGGGYGALDRLLLDPVEATAPRRVARWVWATVLALTGGTFAWLAISVKLTQPTLLIAILEHGEVPLLGLPLPVAALGMAWVELVAGVLLALGILVRAVAVFLIFAFTFFAVTIGETPLFHANLYGLALMLLMAGRDCPRQRPDASGPSRGWRKLEVVQ